MDRIFYRHHGGGIYAYVCDASHSVTGEAMTVCMHLWPDPERIWAWPSDLFHGKDPDGAHRFTRITYDEAMAAMGKAPVAILDDTWVGT